MDFNKFVNKWTNDKELYLNSLCLWYANFMTMLPEADFYYQDNEQFIIITTEQAYHPILAMQEISFLLAELVFDLGNLLCQTVKQVPMELFQ